MTSSISLNEAPSETRIEGTPILAMKKSMTPRKGPTRITANAIHLFAGSLVRGAILARRCEENAACPGAIPFNEIAATLGSAVVGDVAIENFIPDKQISKLSNKRNSLLC